MKVKESPNEMAGCNCPECGKKMVDIPYVPSALDDIVCPKCRSHEVGFLIPSPYSGSVVVACRCNACGLKWSVRVVLPENYIKF